MPPDRRSSRPREGAPSRRAPRTAALTIAAVATIGAVTVWWIARSPRLRIDPAADRNVLLVTIDTLRADALGSYGGRALTPNLDRLAAAGARFDFAHAHAVVTLPSHASILTGRYPYEHGIRDNTGYRLRPGDATLATRLKTAGFSTAAFIGGFPLDRRFGLGAGFDRYDDRLGTGAPGGEPEERERRADAVTAAALDWIHAQRARWLAWVHVYDPHVRYAAPAEWAGRFPSDPYLAEVSWTDYALGPLFDRLASEARPTLVIVTADHGESLGEHGELTHGIFAYEPVLRVPLVVAEVTPGRSPRRHGGIAISAPVRHVDLLPTVLDSVGAAADPGLPGTSLLPAIRGEDAGDRPSYFEAMTSTIARGWAPLRGVLAGREKYVDLPLPELYDLAGDPREATNLVSARLNRAAVLLELLKGFSTAPPGRPQRESAETVERLRSLGYVGSAAGTVRDRFTEADDPKRLIDLERMMAGAAEATLAGRVAEAEAGYAQVIARRPDMEDAYRKLALLYWRSGRPREAIATLEAALRRGVTQAEVRIKLAEYLARTGGAGRAIELLEGSGDRDDPDALIALGNAYLLAGRRREAIATFHRLLEVDPGNALAHENVGVAHLQAGDRAAAESALRQALDADPGLGSAWTALGVVLATTSRRAEAIEAWKRAVTLDGRDLDALYNLTLNLAEAGRLEEAHTYGQRYLEIAPPSLRQDIAIVRRTLGGGPR